ncbi:MAG: FliH/SctL family protein [Candidatus Cohnella colombiensis]|uniref:FliH/SctL family protein n=1 Tax=Candidatus Cohnella colombiensis TaxID=3121368 RepID=A0AA95F090_9BACL|nr:MAG: FliH/SctL family protein [Cohnella sp.]
MSNLIKSTNVISLEDLKRLEASPVIISRQQNISNSASKGEGNDEVDVESHSLKARILSDAEETAQQIIADAQITIAQMKAAAEQEIDAWWDARRSEDGQFREEIGRQGFAEGFAEGSVHAEQQLAHSWEARLKEAQTIVEQAYETKHSVIAEGEQFLVELSCSIAEKILSQELTNAPELAIKLFAQTLSRRKEQGVIVLCVAPSQFAFVQAAKDELSMSLDSQAELQIVPDLTIQEGGCVVRSAFGSIDARVDTQLDAIRQQLLRVAAHSAEEGTRDVAT